MSEYEDVLNDLTEEKTTDANAYFRFLLTAKKKSAENYDTESYNFQAMIASQKGSAQKYIDNKK